MFQIERTIFPDGAEVKSERNDVEIVFNAYKYGAILVTNDGHSKSQPRGILGSRDDLAKLGISVMTADEAAGYIARAIVARDQRIFEHCYRLRIRPPEWVGQD